MTLLGWSKRVAAGELRRAPSPLRWSYQGPPGPRAAVSFRQRGMKRGIARFDLVRIKINLHSNRRTGKLPMLSAAHRLVSSSTRRISRGVASGSWDRVVRRLGSGLRRRCPVHLPSAARVLFGPLPAKPLIDRVLVRSPMLARPSPWETPPLCELVQRSTWSLSVRYNSSRTFGKPDYDLFAHSAH